MFHQPIRFLTVLTLVVTHAMLASIASAQELRPSWQALPNETVFAMQIPNGQAFVDAMRRTQFGKAVFNEQNIRTLEQATEQLDKRVMESMHENLAKFELKVSDLQQLLAGQSGFAVVIEPRPNQPEPMAVMLFWVEPGEELAVRIVNAIQKGVEEQEDHAQKIKRVDTKLAGSDVMHLMIPEVFYDYSDNSFEFPENFGEMTPEEQQKVFEDFQNKQREEGEAYVSDMKHLFITRNGGRLLFAFSPPQSQEAVGALIEEQGDENLDWGTATGQEFVAGVFARFLQAHTNNEPGFVARLANTPGLQASLPAGVLAIEALADVSPLVKLFKTMMHEHEGIDLNLQAMGLDALGPMALRSTVDGSLFRTGMFVSASAPRRGLLQLFEQTELANEPPAWVPRSVVDYSHVSFDLGKAYTQVKQTILEQFPDAQQSFAETEFGFRAFAQADLPTALSALGHQHIIARMESVIVQVPHPMENGEIIEMPQDRWSLIWQLRDELMWKTIVQAVVNSAGGFMGPSLKQVNEQGFTGWRVEDEMYPGSLFIGKGHLTFGLGKNVTEQILSGINNPPQGEGALLNSQLFQRGRQLLPRQSGIIYQLVDVSARAKEMRRLTSFLTRSPVFAFSGAGDDADVKAFLETIEKILPTDEQLETMFGPSVGVFYLNEHGMINESVLELTPVE